MQSFASNGPYEIKGKIIDADSKAVVEFAVVSLLQKTDSVPLFYTATDKNGEFIFRNLPQGEYAVKVHFMGYKDYVSLPFPVRGKPYVIELDAIPLAIESQALGEITVRASSGRPSFQLDKKTIFVENEISASGGSASDLLRKLPSVTQSPEGKIAIHGNSNLLVYINGKPSSLKGSELLQSTPAGDIKKIELITSPSARYDAAGSGGIINLITRRSTLEGFNGNIQASTDHLGGYSSDALFNYKIRKISFFAGADQNRRRNEGDVDYLTKYLTDQSQFDKCGTQKAQRINTGARGGLEFQPTERGKITLTGNAGSFTTTNDGSWNEVTQQVSPARKVTNMASDGDTRKGNYGGADFSFENRQDSTGRLFSVGALWNTFNYNDDFLNLITAATGEQLMRQSTIIGKDNTNFQGNIDYATRTGKVSHLELGYQVTMNQENENYQSFLKGASSPTASNQETRFSETIHAGYATWQLRLKRLDIKAGLRGENLKRELETTVNSHSHTRFDLYPTFNSSFKIDSTQEIWLNFTRRTDRLRSIQLDPLPRWYDFYNVSLGNPDLNNEITDKISLEYLINAKAFTISTELYWYNVNDKIEVIRSLYGSGIIGNRFENAGKERTMGVEINTNISAGKVLSLHQKLDYLDSHLDVNLLNNISQRSYRQFYSETTADLSISPSTQAQVDFAYYGPSLTSQGRIGEVFLAGLSIKQSFLNKKLALTLTGRDIMRQYRKVEEIESPDFTQEIVSRNKFPIRISLSYKFNHYKRDERKMAKTLQLE